MQMQDKLTEHWRILPQTARALKKLKIETIEDLLRHFPARYYDPSGVRAISELQKGENATIFGKLLKPEAKKAFRKKIPMSQAVIENESGKIAAIWFNQPYIAKMFSEGDFVRVEGRVSQRKEELYFSNPKIEKLSGAPEVGVSLFGENRESHFLYPVYPETRGLTSNWIFHHIKKIFSGKGVMDEIEDPVPAEILKKYNLPSLRSSYIWIHAPKKKGDAEAARKRFSFEEIFIIQLDRAREKTLSLQSSAFTIKKTKKDIEEFTRTFPFPLTKAQERAVETITKDLSIGHPMSRLLEGDVGSGKTAVAAALAYAVVTTAPPENKYGALQVAYMAPTEILAEQHFQSFIENFSRYKLPIGLLTGSGAKKFPSKIIQGETLAWTKISKPQLLKWVAQGEIPILIGTHALIEKKVVFKNLAAIIIDEQHRFGIAQRQKLRKKTDIVPHLLSMTATPIPRTLALTIFGDLDLSLLDEMPPGRKPAETKIVLPHQRNEVYEKIREELNKGRQAYVICPRIDEPDPDKEMALMAKSVKEEAKRLKEKVFPEFEIDTLTGKNKPKEKEVIMEKFKKGEIKILVATSVVEVGVNVANATIIIIEGAERFGLAQLHQLRGRVMRSTHQSYCFVFTESKSNNSLRRLKSLSSAKNGFELAEFDLAQRGAGALAGSKQWGVSDLAMDALKNIKLVEAARVEAREIIEKDFDLKNYPLLQKKISQKSQNIHME